AAAGPLPRLPGLGHPDPADRRAERDPPAPRDRHRADQPARRPAWPAPAQGAEGRGRPPLRRLLRPHRPRARLPLGTPGRGRTTPEPRGTRPRRALVPPGLPGRARRGSPPNSPRAEGRRGRSGPSSQATSHRPLEHDTPRPTGPDPADNLSGFPPLSLRPTPLPTPPAPHGLRGRTLILCPQQCG